MTGTRAVHLASGCIRIAELDVPDRLKTIFDELTKVINEHEPNHASIEKIFMSRNPDSALKLGQARGAAIVACAKMALPVFEYSATQIKQAVVALAAAMCHGNTQFGMASISAAKTARRGRVR
jgi:crossover junction endodeoxyribonuclease RuvC